jgi:hypothetical protein
MSIETDVALHRLQALPKEKLRAALDEAVQNTPDVIRRWVEWHPANLMFLLDGQAVSLGRTGRRAPQQGDDVARAARVW